MLSGGCCSGPVAATCQAQAALALPSGTTVTNEPGCLVRQHNSFQMILIYSQFANVEALKNNLHQFNRKTRKHNQ